MPFEMHEANGLNWLTSSQLAEVRHGFSTRKGGVSLPPWNSLNLGVGRGDKHSAVLENYRRFFQVIDLPVERAVLSKQVHETTVRICTNIDAGKGLFSSRDYTADALITNVPDLPLVVFSADCGIILLHDPVCNAVGAVHAGWRGCAAGILEDTVRKMKETYGSDPQNIRAAIGPCIGQCCFETDQDVPNAMLSALGSEATPYLEQRGNKWHVDLAGLNRQWLIHAGLLPEHVDSCGICSACHPELLWSHRKMGDARGAQIAVISLWR